MNNINFQTLNYPTSGTYFLFYVQASDFFENPGPAILWSLHSKPVVVLVTNLWQALKIFAKL